jgi:hypothetical protein
MKKWFWENIDALKFVGVVSIGVIAPLIFWWFS